MKSLSTLTNLYTSLSNNLSGTNQALGMQLMNDRHRLLIQKYFDNEKTVTLTTVGGQTLTLTASPSAGDVSATLSASWPYATGSQLVNFTGKTQTATVTAFLASGAVSGTLTGVWAFTTATVNTTFGNGDVRAVTFTNGSTAITWGQGLSATQTSKTLTTVSVSDQRSVSFSNGSTSISWSLPLDSFATTTIGTVGFQEYLIPANISKVKNDTVNVGQLRFVPAPIQTRAEWDLINFLPYTSDIPNYFFLYNGKLMLWPIPSTTGNIITFNYKARVPDFSTMFLFSDTSGTPYVAGSTTYDYQQGTITTATAGSTTITGSGTKWATAQGAGGGLGMTATRDVTQYNLYFTINAPSGDGIWYPISSFTNDTTLVLASPIVNTAVTGATYSIGQLPVLSEDFHDMLPYGALMTYFNSIVEKPDKFKTFQEQYVERLALLEDYAGTKTVQVDLGQTPNLQNPNLYMYAQTP